MEGYGSGESSRSLDSAQKKAGTPISIADPSLLLCNFYCCSMKSASTFSSSCAAASDCI